jgi:23S rRNA U2552 (ribose-2'-O)-methylase RlmE/FtsJ
MAANCLNKFNLLREFCRIRIKPVCSSKTTLLTKSSSKLFENLKEFKIKRYRAEATLLTLEPDSS